MALWSALFAAAAAATPVAARSVSAFEAHSLQDDVASRLAAALREHGALTLTDVPGLAERNLEALTALTACGRESVDGFQRKELLDGSERFTLSALALADFVQEAVLERCRGLKESLMPLRRVVNDLGSSVIAALAPAYDELAAAKRHGGLARLFAKGRQLEHFHFYRPSGAAAEAGERSRAVPFHTDKGAFLLLTKPLVFEESGLVREPSGVGLALDAGGPRESLPRLRDGEALLLAGEALREFLEADARAPRHAVYLTGLPTTSLRAWHGRMFLFPDESMNSRNETARALFMAPISEISQDPTGWLVGLEADCATQVESCWMGNPKDYCVGVCADGSLEQCLMPDLSVGQCDKDGMQPECAFRCKDGSDTSKANAFCNDRENVAMHMAGFAPTYDAKRACVVLFFQSWKLDRPWKFLFAMAGVILMGVATQGLVALRPVVSKVTNGNRVVGSLFFGANTVLGWFLMLVAMTFSTELFICATAGLVVGHFVFAGGQSRTSSPEQTMVELACQSPLEDLSASSRRLARGQPVTGR